MHPFPFFIFTTPNPTKGELLKTPVTELYRLLLQLLRFVTALPMMQLKCQKCIVVGVDRK